MESGGGASYDEVLYNSWPFCQSHPDRLATVASVFGMDPPPTVGAEFRMLELGSACGDNLIPLAMQHPRAEFLGVDYSQRQIDAANQTASSLGVANVRFQKVDILEFPDKGEPFDFVVAHGVYSWVPAPVRDRLLAICRNRLKPNGVAYISYNVHPGCKMKEIVRDLLLHHVRHLTDPPQRIQQAHAFLRFMADVVPHDNPAYAALYKGTLKSLGEAGASQTRLYHDLLESVNHPVYFHEFMDHAARHDLQFLGEADIQEMQAMRFPPEVSSALDKLGDDVIQREQYLDFIKHRPFRQTLLCHREVSLQRELQPASMAKLRVAADIQCDTPDADPDASGPLQFRHGAEVEASVDDPMTKSALLHLNKVWPQSVPFGELEAAARRQLSSRSTVVQPAAEYDRGNQELTENLLQLHAAGLVELHVHEPALKTSISERPVASSWARRQAEASNRVTNLRYASVKLSDVHRQLLLLLDGTRDRETLLNDLVRNVKAEGLIVVHEGIAMQGGDEIRQALNEMLDESLQMAATLALLVA